MRPLGPSYLHTHSPSDGAFIAMHVQSTAQITLGKPAIAANCALLFAWLKASYGNRIYLAEMRMITFKTVRMALLRFLTDRSANSLCNDPVARKSSVVRTCIGTDVWLLADSLSKPGPNSVGPTEFQEDSSWIAIWIGWQASHHHKPKNHNSNGTPVPFECKHLQYLLTTPTLPLSTYRLLPYFEHTFIF